MQEGDVCLLIEDGDFGAVIRVIRYKGYERCAWDNVYLTGSYPRNGHFRYERIYDRHMRRVNCTTSAITS